MNKYLLATSVVALIATGARAADPQASDRPAGAPSDPSARSIEKEILEDVEPYRRAPERYREILVFIYDDSCSVHEHDTTWRALRSVRGVVDVVIVSRPSHLPATAERRE